MLRKENAKKKAPDHISSDLGIAHISQLLAVATAFQFSRPRRALVLSYLGAQRSPQLTQHRRSIQGRTCVYCAPLL